MNMLPLRVAPLALLVLLAACGDDGAVSEDAKPTPPLEQMVEETGDWSALVPAVGRTPAASAMLSRGPIVTDLNALVGPDAIDFRGRLNERGGPLHEEEGILVSMTPAGPKAAYLLVDLKGRQMEAGYRTASGWQVKRTPGAALTVPKSVLALRSAA